MLCKNLILAIPPRPLIKILKNSRHAAHAFGPFHRLSMWEKRNRYITYIPMTFHWNHKVPMKKVWGFPRTGWKIAFIILTNYMKFQHPNSKTVISCCITDVNVRSKYTGKTANESSQTEMIQETFRQLKETLSHLPNPSQSLLSPGIFKNPQTSEWDTKDDSYIRTTDAANGYPISNKSHLFSNLYSVGTHNGNHLYDFTTMESAVSNAVVLCHSLIPQSYWSYPIGSQFTVENAVWISAAMVFFLVFWNRKYIFTKLAFV